MCVSSDLVTYSVLLVVAAVAAEYGKGYDYHLYTDDYHPYTELSKSNRASELQDPDEIHELHCADCKAIPKLATVHDDHDDLLLSRSTPVPLISRNTNAGDRRRLRQTTVVKSRGGVSYWSSHGADFNRTYI